MLAWKTLLAACRAYSTFFANTSVICVHLRNTEVIRYGQWDVILSFWESWILVSPLFLQCGYNVKSCSSCLSKKMKQVWKTAEPKSKKEASFLMTSLTGFINPGLPTPVLVVIWEKWLDTFLSIAVRLLGTSDQVPVPILLEITCILQWLKTTLYEQLL